MNEELKITSEDIRLLKEMKDNCLKASVYDDEKRLLKANAITKFLVEHEEKQELIDYLNNQIKHLDNLINKSKPKPYGEELNLYESSKLRYLEILSKIEKE